MKKIKEMDYANDYNMAKTWGKLNEVIRVVNNLKCVEEEQPIYETLGPQDALIISKTEDGLLIAVNDGNGRVLLERVPWPKDVKEEE